MWPPLDGKSASRLQDAGYTVEYHPNKLGERSGTGYISLPVANTAVSFPAPDYILKFSLDIPGGMVTIHEAWNAYNDTVRALKLRDMIMSLWIVHAQQSPNDLKCIKYETIVESKSSLLLPQIFENLAECPEIYMDPAPILPGEGQAVIISHKPMECENRTLRRQTWPTLNTQLPFVLGARKMLKEYAELHGRFIDSLVVTECRIEYRRSANLYINIGGKGPSNHELGVALIQALDKTRLMVPTQRRVHQRVECLKALDIVNGVTLPGLFQYSGRRRALIRRAKGMVSGGAKVEIKDHMEEAVYVDTIGCFGVESLLTQYKL
ncbi:unnamed protein product [Discula destructiva]